MTEKFNPINVWNKHKYVDIDNNDRIDEPCQQRSSSIDQGNTNAQAQREPVQVLPSDFGSRILNPVEQDSNFKNDSEDMISRNKKPTNYDLFNMKTSNNHKSNADPHSTFFGDSNVARRTSRSTLDQEGLHRGNISTLPSAGDARRRSLRQHANDPDVSEVKDDNNKSSSFMGRTTAAVVTSLGAATAAAAGFGVSEQLRDKSKQENTAMPSTWPESSKVNDNVEPAIHGQTACYKHKDEVCDTITDSDKHSFCDRVQEPAIHGQTPSFYQENVNNNNTIASVNKNNGAAHQTIAAAVGEATASVQDNNANVNNTTVKPAIPVRRLSNSLGNLFGKSSPPKEKSEKSLWSAGNTMDTSNNNSKKGILAGAGLGAGLGGLLSRKNQINDAKSTDAYQLLGDNTANTTSLKNDQAVPSTPPHASSAKDDESVTESVDELPQTWGDQSTPVVLDDQDPLSRPHAADRAFAVHDLGHPSSHTQVPSTQDTTTQAQIVHNDVDPNADHAKMGFDKKTSAAGGILGGAGIGAAVGSLFGRDKKSNATNTNTVKKVDTGLDQTAFGNNEQQAFGGNQALGNTPVVLTSDTVQTPTGAVQDVNPLSTHANIDNNSHAATGAGALGGAGLGAAAGASLDHNNDNATHPLADDSHLHAHRLDYHDELFITSPTDHTVKEVDLDCAQVPHNNADHTKMGSNNKSSTAAGVLGGAGLGAGAGSMLSRDKHDDNYKATAHPLDDGDQIIATPVSENRSTAPDSATHAQIVHNDVDPNADHAKMGFDKKTSTVAGVLGGAGLGAGIGSLLSRDKHNENDKSTATPISDNRNNVNAALDTTDHAQIVHNDVDPNADHAKMDFNKKRPSIGELSGTGFDANIGSVLKDENDKSNVENRNTNAALDSATQAQPVHNDVNPNADHSKMGFNKKSGIGAGILGGAGIGAAMSSLLGRKKSNDSDIHNKSTTTTAPASHDHAQATTVDTTAAVNTNGEQKAFGNNEQQAFGGSNAFGNAPLVGILKKPAAAVATATTAGTAASTGTDLARDESISPHAKGPIIHNALNINKNNNANTTTGDITHTSSTTDKPVDMKQPWTNTEVDQEAVKPRRWSITTTTPDHHVEKRLAVGGIMGATANTEGRKVLNKLYPENSHWDSNAPIESRLGEVEVTDQPRRRSSVSETLVNMFGKNKNKGTDDTAVQHNTIHEVNTILPVQSATAGTVGTDNHRGVTAAGATAAGATAAGATAAGAGILGAPNVNNYDESISSTRATRGVIVPDDARHNEVKDRLTTTPQHQNFAQVPDSIQRDARTTPIEPRRKSSFTQGIKGSITKAVRRLSSRRRSSSSINKDSIHVRHLSDAEMFKKQTTAVGNGSNTNPALGSTAAAAAVPVHGAPVHTTTGEENIGPLETGHDIVHPAATTGVPVNNNLTTTPLADVTNGDFGNNTTLRRGSSTSSEHLKYTGVQKGYARIPGVHTLRPADDAHAPDNNESYFIKEEAKAPTMSTLVSGHMEARRGSLQTVGKLIGSGHMQDEGALKEVSGQGKIYAYNATHNKL